MNESPLFTKTYAFLLWLLPLTAGFPKYQRLGLARRLEDSAYNFYEAILHAAQTKDATRWLRTADAELGKTRFYLRLGKDLQAVSFGQYEHGAKMLVEIGKLLGGWLKQA